MRSSRRRAYRGGGKAAPILAMPSGKWFSQNYTADSCPCSVGGCQSLWPCTPSRLCFERVPLELDDEASLGEQASEHSGSMSGSHGVTFLLFLAFNSSLVRNVFAARPERARDREVNRAVWFAHTAKLVGTRLPIHAVVAGQRDERSEKRLRDAGVRLLAGPMIPTPAWASKWHRLSFNKIAALSFTQFRKVIVLDNDAGLLRNMDHVRRSPTPAAVFHTTIGPLARRTHCAVTTGLLILRPSKEGYGRALRLLRSMNYTDEQYDGGDEEFWLRYFAEGKEPLYELPWKYHAHRLLPMPAGEWHRVKMMHLITALQGRGWHIPKNATAPAERYY